MSQQRFALLVTLWSEVHVVPPPLRCRYREVPSDDLDQAVVDRLITSLGCRV
jgi:hypothetical protein